MPTIVIANVNPTIKRRRASSSAGVNRWVVFSMDCLSDCASLVGLGMFPSLHKMAFGNLRFSNFLDFGMDSGNPHRIRNH